MTPPEMTLRDWFAGQALAGWAAGRNRDTQQTSGAPDYIARTSYGYADAMLAERERRAKEEAKEAEEDSQKAREWVKAAGLKVVPHKWGGVLVMDGSVALGYGGDLAGAVAEAKANLAAKPTPLAPEAKPAPAPSTPTREDDEASALDADVTVYRAHPSSGWRAYTTRGAFVITEAEPTIARALRALRALRAKVKGGAR